MNPPTDRPFAATASRLRLDLTATGDPRRPELESFVRSAFAHKHDADVRSFMPELVSFHDARDALCGVVGLRAAAPGPLFLERYLDASVEEALTRATGAPVSRREVVEVGNLAGRNCRTAMRMVAQLPGYLLAREYRWIVFTATSAVREILLAFGAPLVELARAEPARVAGGPDRWGRYYETDPRVFAGHLPDSRRIASFAASGSRH